MNGKSKCKILKQIRKEIAKQNGIEFVTSECKFQGKCTGTCPKCEAEVRYLEQELAKRRSAGKAVAVAGIAAAMLVSGVGCVPSASKTTEPEPSHTEETHQPTDFELMGDVPYVEGELETEPLLGEPMETTAGVPMESTDFDLMGDFPYEVGEVPEN